MKSAKKSKLVKNDFAKIRTSRKSQRWDALGSENVPLKVEKWKKIEGGPFGKKNEKKRKGTLRHIKICEQRYLVLSRHRTDNRRLGKRPC